jgi:hypothetical protein
MWFRYVNAKLSLSICLDKKNYDNDEKNNDDVMLDWKLGVWKWLQNNG